MEANNLRAVAAGAKVAEPAAAIRAAVNAEKSAAKAAALGIEEGAEAELKIANRNLQILNPLALNIRLEPGSGDEVVATWKRGCCCQKGAYGFSTTVPL